MYLHKNCVEVCVANPKTITFQIDKSTVYVPNISNIIVFHLGVLFLQRKNVLATEE